MSADFRGASCLPAWAPSPSSRPGGPTRELGVGGGEGASAENLAGADTLGALDCKAGLMHGLCACSPLCSRVCFLCQAQPGGGEVGGEGPPFMWVEASRYLGWKVLAWHPLIFVPCLSTPHSCPGLGQASLPG